MMINFWRIIERQKFGFRLSGAVVNTLVLLFFLQFGCKKDQGKITGESSDTSSHRFSWNIDTIGTFQSELRDVWGANENSVYAVGITFLPNRSLPTNIIRWNGVAWQPVDFLEGSLLTITGFSENNIWVGGFWAVNSTLYALIGNWNGSTWSVWKPQEYGAIFCLWGTSSNNLFACGANGLILHFDGTRWTRMESGTSHSLLGIWGAGGAVYATGGTSNTGIGVLLKLENGTWRRLLERGFRSDSLSGVVSALWAKREDVFYISEYSGKDASWTKLPLPNDNTYVERIRGQEENDIFYIGDFGMLIHWNGSSWYRYPEFYKKPDGDVLYGVHFQGNKVFVVGQTTGFRGIVYRGRR